MLSALVGVRQGESRKYPGVREKLCCNVGFSSDDVLGGRHGLLTNDKPLLVLGKPTNEPFLPLCGPASQRLQFASRHGKQLLRQCDGESIAGREGKRTDRHQNFAIMHRNLKGAMSSVIVLNFVRLLGQYLQRALVSCNLQLPTDQSQVLP